MNDIDRFRGITFKGGLLPLSLGTDTEIFVPFDPLETLFYDYAYLPRLLLDAHVRRAVNEFNPGVIAINSTPTEVKLSVVSVRVENSYVEIVIDALLKSVAGTVSIEKRFYKQLGRLMTSAPLVGRENYISGRGLYIPATYINGAGLSGTFSAFLGPHATTAELMDRAQQHIAAWGATHYRRPFDEGTLAVSATLPAINSNTSGPGNFEVIFRVNTNVDGVPVFSSHPVSAWNTQQTAYTATPPLWFYVCPRIVSFLNYPEPPNGDGYYDLIANVEDTSVSDPEVAPPSPDSPVVTEPGVPPEDAYVPPALEDDPLRGLEQEQTTADPVPPTHWFSDVTAELRGLSKNALIGLGIAAFVLVAL